MKNLTYILFLIFALSFKQNTFANVEIVNDSIKKEYWLTFSGLYFPNNGGHLFRLGTSLEKKLQNSKKMSVLSFFHSYDNYFQSFNDVARYSSLTYGWKYNILKKNKLNFGIHCGLFVFDTYYGNLSVFHSFGVTIIPSVEYKYCFKNYELGIDLFITSNLGKFKTPYIYPLEVVYVESYGYNFEGFFNLKISKKL